MCLFGNMHARHRSPGNGYRLSSMGMGLAASRISPEGSIRGHGFHNSEYRNFNRGFGRGQSKPYQQPHLSRKGDIFMEAGRLATEYLISTGLLPPSALPVKWQNGSLKKQVGDFQDGENLQLPAEGRTSALARLGNAVSDSGSGRRRFSDEYNPTGSRNHTRGRRRMGSFRSYGSDWNGRSGSWDKARASPDTEGDEDSTCGYPEEQLVGKDVGSGVQKSRPSELPPISDDVGDDSEAEPENTRDDMSSKAGSSRVGRDIPLETDGELNKRPDDSRVLDVAPGEMKDGTSNDSDDETEKQTASEDLTIQDSAVDDDIAGKSGTDLLRLCNFAKVPTKTRSSLMYKALKIDLTPTTEKGNTCDIGPLRGSSYSSEDNPVEESLGGALSDQTQKSQCLNLDVSRALTVESLEDAEELDSKHVVEQGKCVRSQSFPERAFMYEQEASQGPPGFGRCSSMVKERGEKRAGQQSDTMEGIKKLKEWLPSLVSRSEECFTLSNLSKMQTSSQERASPVDEVVSAANEKNSMDISLFPKSGGEQCIEFAEEKRLLPSSFKICDLNLMGTSDMNENHDTDPILLFPSILETKKEAAPVDIDLSISNCCNLSDECGGRPADGKEVEVIDLENDSGPEDNALPNSERKTESVFMELETFPNHAQNTSDVPDAQDGYGLMISELLGNDISNCSSVPTDINSLDHEMNLHNGEGMLGGDDDSIYMSLGEIPISLLRVWEQPTQEYEKPF